MDVLFGVREIALMAVAAALFGWLMRRKRSEPRKERPVARLVGALLEPIYYWLDWKGPDGRPSRSKVAYGITLFVLLSGVIWFGKHQSEHAPTGIEIGLTWPYVAYVLLVAAYSLGPHAFNAFLSTKLGDGLAQVMRARASGGLPKPDLPEE